MTAESGPVGGKAGAESAPAAREALDLPLRVTFTEEGISFFTRNRRKLEQLRLADNVLESGLVLSQVNPANLQKMIRLDYVSRLELARVEFVSRRREIIDLNKLIVYGMLYRKFNDQCHQALLTTPFVRNWNRMHPAHCLDERSQFNEECVADFLKANRPHQQQAAAAMLAPLRLSLQSLGSSMDRDERMTALATAGKFLRSLRSTTWFLLLKAATSREYPALLRSLGNLLRDWIMKVKIADYLSLIIVELATYAENTKLQSAARKLYRVRGRRPLEDAVVRQQVQERLEDRKDFLYLTWRIRRSTVVNGSPLVLQVDLANRSYDYRGLKVQIENKKRIDLREKSLADFYQQMTEEEASEGLGLYYLSYLDQACSELNIRFDSQVSHVGPNDLTMISLSLGLR